MSGAGGVCGQREEQEGHQKVAAMRDRGAGETHQPGARRVVSA